MEGFIKNSHTKTAHSKYTGKGFQVERGVSAKVWIWEGSGGRRKEMKLERRVNLRPHVSPED